MSHPKIVVSIHGGLVQSVYCSEQLEDLIVVDWDAEQDSEGVTEVVRGDRTLRAHVTHPIIEPLNRLAGSDLDTVIEAANRRKSPVDLTHEELVEIVTVLQRALYGREHRDGRWSYDADKQWSGGDVCEAVAELLDRFGLVPDSDGKPIDGQ